LGFFVLYDTQVDTSVVVGEGAFKTAYNFKNRPNLLVFSHVKYFQIHVFSHIFWLHVVFILFLTLPSGQKNMNIEIRIFINSQLDRGDLGAT
jgi:hypothetical protein